MKKLLFLMLLFPLRVNAQVISTIAGNGESGCTGDGFAAIEATFSGLDGMAIDSSGNIYVVEYGCSEVRMINKSGIITRFAGNNSNVYSGDNDAATLAGLHQPTGIAIDKKGNVYIADNLDNRVRKVNTSGIITTFAGTGTFGYNGGNIPATTAQLMAPFDVATDNIGNVYISDFTGARVHKVDTNGIISTIAVGPGPVVGLAVDDSGSVYMSCSNNESLFGGITNSILKLTTSGSVMRIAGSDSSGYSGDGGAATSALLNSPYKIAIDKMGELFIADGGNNRIRKVDRRGIITTIAGTGVSGFSGDGKSADSGQLSNPQGITFDSCGNLYIGDFLNSRIRRITFNSGCWPEDINKINALKDIHIFPNPVAASLTITAPTIITTLSITNLIGQTISSHEYNAETVQVDVADLPPGVYFVRITGTEVRKFVKQ